LKDYVTLLRDAGAHLHPDEIVDAKEKARESSDKECWTIAIQEDG
jgi:hypothetical protein